MLKILSNWKSLSKECSEGTLTRYPPGSLRELLFLVTPLIFSFASANLMVFCNHLFLSHHSLETFKAFGIAESLATLFQIPLIRLTAINQVFISKSLGKGVPYHAGAYTWQMIWCSLLTILLVLPISHFIGPLYFAGTENVALEKSYFSIMMMGNFLFPLGATLAAFQAGIGKTKIIALTALFANFLNVFLSYFLINGIQNVLPPLGIQGAAIATLTSQGIYCAILFSFFLFHPSHKKYQTQNPSFYFPFFKKSLKTSIPATLSLGFACFTWALSIRIVATKGGDYETLISFGLAIWAINAIFRESLHKGLITLFSYALGQNNWKLIWKTLRSGFILVITIFLLLAISFVFLNHHLIHWMIGEEVSFKTLQYLRLSCYWIWLFFILEGAGYALNSLLIALKKTSYIMIVSVLMNTLTVYVPFYIGFKLNNWAPDKIWMTIWFCSFASSVFYLKKILQTEKKKKNLVFT